MIAFHEQEVIEKMASHEQELVEAMKLMMAEIETINEDDGVGVKIPSDDLGSKLAAEPAFKKERQVIDQVES